MTKTPTRRFRVIVAPRARNLPGSHDRFLRDALPDPAVYYSRELRRLTHSSRDGWALALCPFHEDERPSFAVNLQHGGWCCFAACGRGDLVSFQMKRHDQSFAEAAKALGAWGVV